MSTNHPLVVRLGLYFILCLFAPSNYADIEQSRLDAAEADIQSRIDEGKLSGAVLMVAQSGRVQMHKALGYQNVEDETPMENETIFRIFSMTKPVTKALSRKTFLNYRIS